MVFVDCRNGERRRIVIESGRAGIEDDRFELELPGAAELAVRIVGRLRDDSAKDRIEATVRPHGAVCAGTVRWRAKRD